MNQEAASENVTIGEAIIEGPEERAPELGERRTDEIVIAIVAAVGSGGTTCAEEVSRILQDEYGYDVQRISISSLINENSASVDLDVVDISDAERIEKLQNTGNALRKHFGNAILAEYAIEKIHGSRSDSDRAESIRRCWVIDSLKHPKEEEILRNVYGDCFWLIGVFSPEDVRIKRLKDKSLSSEYIEKIKKTDLSGGSEFAQSVNDTLRLADMFIRNDKDNRVGLVASISRFLELVFAVGVVTPTLHESAMLAAEGEAARSACLSRQVGAVIFSEAGEQIGQGCNDVPKYKGGMYNGDVPEDDNRCFMWKDKICHNDFHKRRIYKDISDAANVNSEDIEIRNAITQTGVRNLIEFSRAVHAEMEAILSVSRSGKSGIVGSSLYCTTFPCHSCARHIVASGVTTVFYVEAYPKSLALTLHEDAISTSESDRGKKVLFLQYEGAGPRSFTRLFGQKKARKVDGRLDTQKKISARPSGAAPLDGLATREQLVLARFKRIEKEHSHGKK